MPPPQQCAVQEQGDAVAMVDLGRSSAEGAGKLSKEELLTKLKKQEKAMRLLQATGADHVAAQVNEGIVSTREALRDAEPAPKRLQSLQLGMQRRKQKLHKFKSRDRQLCQTWLGSIWRCSRSFRKYGRAIRLGRRAGIQCGRGVAGATCCSRWASRESLGGCHLQRCPSGCACHGHSCEEISKMRTGFRGNADFGAVGAGTGAAVKFAAGEPAYAETQQREAASK
eukprot:3214374-Amphidinium_carterae.2